jgi:butyryl-CoA dehydrogenase
MAEYMSMEHLKFLLFEVHKIDSVFAFDRYKDYDKESVEILLSSIKSWADQDWYPTYREMDEKPVYFKEGKVYSHPILKKVLQHAGDNGYIGSYFDYEEGGSQMPLTVHHAVNHIVEAANNHISGYIGLTAGSAHLISSFGSDALKHTYIPNMLNGKWSGTMCLTEPQAGSSLSDVASLATPTDQGYFKIKGQKIFISGGDHEASENFVHLALVRIEGAPSGTKGISLFVIPKFRPNEDGSTSYNDVTTAGDFQKMGQRGYSTVHLTFGENDDCRGWLVGEANQGLKYMFQMMNGARLDVGMSAASTATAAYYASLQYAKERPQGRRIEDNGQKNISQEQTLIINHADVRRMLLKQKAITEGALSLLIEASVYADTALYGPQDQKADALLMLELLTPMAKTYPSEKGKEAIDNGLQVLGGYGFCSDFVLQQYYRDIRIMAIYEGTTGIQSIDLLGRKVTMENGRALQLLMTKMNLTIEEASKYDELKPYAIQLSEKISDVQKVLAKLIPLALQGKHELYLADATIFMTMASTVVVAHQWLKIAYSSKLSLLTNQGGFGEEFYESKLHTMKFFYKYELSQVSSCLETLMNDDVLTIARADVKVL